MIVYIVQYHSPDTGTGAAAFDNHLAAQEYYIDMDEAFNDDDGSYVLRPLAVPLSQTTADQKSWERLKNGYEWTAEDFERLKDDAKGVAACI